MPVSYRIHDGAGLVLMTGSGPMTFEEWRQCLVQALGDPRYRPGFRILSDRRRLERGYTFGTVESIVAFFRTHAAALGPTRWAVVTPSADPAASMVQLSAVLAESTLVQVQGFSDLGPALEWLLQVVDDEQLAELQDWIGQDTE